MPDYRPNAPSAGLFSADEHLVLCDWFKTDYPRSGQRIDDILDEWGIPAEINGYSRSSAGVAQIVLGRIQCRLPQWAAVGDRVYQARPYFDRRVRRKVELWPQHLFTINWADTAPGYSWPVAYNAIYVPGFDRTVVTASADCTEVFGVCDLAIGAFGPKVSILQGTRDIIVNHWSWQRDEWGQARWAYLFDTGLVGEAESQAWADEVWANHREE
jgi:hypothetical protein